MFTPDSRFLVIDDFKTMRSIIKKNLQTLGFSQIDEAADGVLAFEAIQKALAEKKPYTCIISDWNMPNMTGLELLKKVRSIPETKGVPFVLVTAENEQSQVVEAAMSGVSNYIVKPFSAADFTTKLTAVYNKHFAKKAA